MERKRVQRWIIDTDTKNHDEVDVIVSWQEREYAQVTGGTTKRFEPDPTVGLCMQSNHAGSRCGLKLSREKVIELRDALDDALKEIS